MLARTVDACKGLFMQEAYKVVLLGDLFHDLHRKLVMIHRHVCGIVNRSELVLAGRDLIMLGLYRYPQLPQLQVEIMHISGDPWLDGSEIVILHFLPLGRKSSKQCPSRKDQVLSLFVGLLFYQEVFLLGSHRCGHSGHILLSYEVEYLCGLP